MSDDIISELDLVVGSMITVRPDEDRATYDEECESVAAVQDQLREEGIDIDLLSQPGTEVWEGSLANMGALYQLSRLAARIDQGQDIAEVIADGPEINDDLDRAVTDVWDDLIKSRFQHLINLQGINSYYMPADFEQPIWLSFEDESGEEDNAFFGSSACLQRELADLAPLLIKAGVSHTSEAYRCLELLREAAAKSLECSLPIIVW
ncbi:MAG: hypothetical protein HGA19_13935 [Oscillochloris sp.]|nr:hypothetical protein [Oscillochloris sp.]